MFVLKKLFKLRESVGPSTESEKPFLEHLEDLRDVIVKIVITLFIATIGCYIFRGTLLDVLRSPMEEVWIEIQEQKLPDDVSPDLWEKAKKTAYAASGLSLEQRHHLYAQFEDEKLRHYAQAATYYRGALLIEDSDKELELEKRQNFVQDFPQIDQRTKDLLLVLLEKLPNATLNAKGSVVYMQSLKPTETFMLAIKLSIFAGIIISFPFLLYFILQFVLPGLKENERKALWPAMIIGFGLFLIGIFFCYFVVLPKALDFFYTYSGGMGVENEWRIGDYITFTTQFTLIFGLAFELPVIVMTLVKIGLLSYQTMSNTRAYAVLSIFVVGAIITPTGDALTLSLLAAPMCLLYEMCIWLAYFNHKKELAAEAQEEAEIMEYVNRQNESSQSPLPVPVPGRISTEEVDHADYHDAYHDHDHEHDDYHSHFSDDDEGEGEELDDGEIEDFSETVDDSEEAAKDEDAYGQVDDESDYNSVASFESFPEEKDVDEPDEDGNDDSSEDK